MKNKDKIKALKTLKEHVIKEHGRSPSLCVGLCYSIDMVNSHIHADPVSDEEHDYLTGLVFARFKRKKWGYSECEGSGIRGRITDDRDSAPFLWDPYKIEPRLRFIDGHLKRLRGKSLK